jgi:branched-chain amino acid transport system ATP-binding protein
MALSVSHYGYVLETGELVAEGTAESLRDNTLIKDIYLGKNE